MEFHRGGSTSGTTLSSFMNYLKVKLFALMTFFLSGGRIYGDLIWKERKFEEEYNSLISLFQSQTFEGLSGEVFSSDGMFTGQSHWNFLFNCLAKVVKSPLEPFLICCSIFCGSKEVMNF